MAEGGAGGGPGGGQAGLEEVEVRRRFNLHRGLNSLKLPIADQREEILDMIEGKSNLIFIHNKLMSMSKLGWR